MEYHDGHPRTPKVAFEHNMNQNTAIRWTIGTVFYGSLVQDMHHMYVCVCDCLMFWLCLRIGHADLRLQRAALAQLQQTAMCCTWSALVAVMQQLNPQVFGFTETYLNDPILFNFNIV